MSATSTEGTGQGSVYRVMPRIINGVVKNANLKRSSGEIVKVSLHTFDDGVLNNSSETYTDFASATYSPALRSSRILVEYHAQYTVNGSGSDNFHSTIKVNGDEITWRDQVWVASETGGGGTRSATLFPISMAYNNSDEDSLEIKVCAKRNGSDDTLSVDTSSAYLKITEVVR
jgi:hypothetical protein